MPQDFIMDIEEESRYGDGSYPKLKQLLDAKTKLIKEKAHPAMVVKTQDLRKTDLMKFEKQFDVIVLKLKLDDPEWSLD